MKIDNILNFKLLIFSIFSFQVSIYSFTWPLASLTNRTGLLTPPFQTLSSEDLHESRLWFPASVADFFNIT